ncbi:molybdopterin molybdotransferase MoeA [Candidatus Bathyarchaeota archaeon]|nr:molybdopterin molybdotransferase MoeA [Candidatus Bathyarchaeota archaeon]
MAEVRGKGFQRLIPIDEAISHFFSRVALNKMKTESLPITASLGRVLAKDITCIRDVPPFDRSAVDGYAVKAEDVFGALGTNPIVLTVQGKSSTGIIPNGILEKGATMQIATGAPMPNGADAVVMVEYTQITGSSKVEIYGTVTPGENVSAQGEDVKKNDLILKSGIFLKPQDIGILAALGISDIDVMMKPRIGILSTGNELVNLGQEIPEGTIFDSNKPMLSSMVQLSGAEPIDLGTAVDQKKDIADKLRAGLESADMILTSGGTSVGQHDLLPDIVNTLGPPGVLVHGVAMRPGKPVALCAVGEKPIILLPGFPVAALIAYDVFVEPIILRMLGASIGLNESPTIKATAERRIPSSPGVRSFVRGRVLRRNGKNIFEPLRATGSGIISSMVRANGMLVIPENKEGVEEGEEVEIRLLRAIEEE